jgi:hypothetical protein
LTSACKELSRERDAMIFIVSVCMLCHETGLSLIFDNLRDRKKKIPRYPNTYIELDIIFERASSTKPEKWSGRPLFL